MRPNSELVDIYGDDGRPRGVKPRDSVHLDGNWHRTFHCLILSGEKDALGFTLQRRSRQIAEYPGLIDVSVAGHLVAGEDMRDAVREIREEVGVDVAFEVLEPLGCYPLVVREGPIWSREWTEIFLLRDDRAPDAFACQPEEVASLVSIRVRAARAVWRGDVPEADAEECVDGVMSTIRVRAADFVNDVPDYWYYVADAVLGRFG